MADRRRLRQDAEPAEWIDPLIGLDRGRFDAGAADAVKTVAAGDEGRIRLVGDAILDVGDRAAGRCSRRQPRQRQTFRDPNL